MDISNCIKDLKKRNVRHKTLRTDQANTDIAYTTIVV